MATLGIDSHPTTEPVKKDRWGNLTKAVLGVMIAFFTWVVFSNLFLLYFGRPLIKLH